MATRVTGVSAVQPHTTRRETRERASLKIQNLISVEYMLPLHSQNMVKKIVG